MDLEKFKLKKKINFKLKRFVSLVLTIMVIISSISSINIFADAGEEYFYEETNESYDYKHPGGYNTPYIGYFLKDNDTLGAVVLDVNEGGDPLYTYCIDPNIEPVEGAKYSIVDINDIKDYENYYADDNYKKN